MPYVSKANQQAASHRHYLANKDIVKARRATGKERNRQHLLSYLATHPCNVCGEADPLVLQFDHRDPALKEATITSLVRAGCSLDRLDREISKCDVLCANCHSRRTAHQFNHYKTRMSSSSNG